MKQKMHSFLLLLSMSVGMLTVPIQAKKKFRPLRIIKGGVKTATGLGFLYVSYMAFEKEKQVKYSNASSIKGFPRVGKRFGVAMSIPGGYLVYKGMKDIKKGIGF